MINSPHRSAAISKAPEPGLMGGILPLAYNGVSMLTDYISPEERFVTCPNQDVVYGFGFSDLDQHFRFGRTPGPQKPWNASEKF